ncbi:hypothetical protein ACSBOB_04500 [Mesorhizobium sp. ASY16-5R]|uniref:hypothetical protein n=1 Tax=Mesorhizobium sp. ASY16-5R TaxID=3445772 RepID=UPI003F9FA972
MNTLFNACWKGSDDGGDQRNGRPRPSGVARLLVAFGLIAVAIAALDQAAQKEAADDSLVSFYTSTRNGEER